MSETTLRHQTIDLDVAERSPGPGEDSDPLCGSLIAVPIDDRLVDNPLFTRRVVGDLDGLIASITFRGVLQPLIITRAVTFGWAHPEMPLCPGAEFVLLAGHRRRAAAQRAGMHTVAAIVRDDLVSTADASVLTLVENIHRAKLAALEESRMLAVLRDLGLSQREICLRTGISQSQVSKRLRLLDLPVALQDEVEDGALAVVDALTLLHDLHDPADQVHAVAVSRKNGHKLRSVVRDMHRAPGIGGEPAVATATRAPSAAPAASRAKRDRLWGGSDVAEQHSSACEARVEACRRAVHAGLSSAGVTELLVDLTLDPPLARSGEAVAKVLAMARQWAQRSGAPADGDTADDSLRTGGCFGNDLAAAVALAYREIDLECVSPLGRPWRNAPRRHVRRLQRWGMHEPSPYEDAKLTERPDE